MSNQSPLYNKINIGDTLHFRQGDSVSLGRGWSQPEADFCWTDGRFAEISIVSDLNLSSNYSVALACHPYVSEARPTQDVMLFIDGLLMATEILDREEVVYIPLPNHPNPYRDFRLTMYLPSAVSPYSENKAVSDTRLLALRVFSMVIVNNRDIP